MFNGEIHDMSVVEKHPIELLPEDLGALKVIIASQAKRIITLKEYVTLGKLQKFGVSSVKPP